MTDQPDDIIPASAASILEKKGFAHLATVGPAGELHNSPVWYGWDGTQLLVSQTTGRQKYKNVGVNPVVAISIVDPDDPYRYLEIRGRVEEITEDEGNAFIDSMAKKYLDQDAYPFHQPGDHRVVLHIRPEHATGR